MHYQGLADIPRRYLDKEASRPLIILRKLDKMIAIVSIIVFAVQMCLC
jgi:cytochrome c oxidase subunit 1